MKILTGKQIREADRYTMEHEPISSIELMERASLALANQLQELVSANSPLLFFIGKGNNGGDGLAMARILASRAFKCSVFCLFEKEKRSAECKANYERLPEEVRILKDQDLSNISSDTIIIDAILGTGVKGEILDPIKTVIEKINSLPNRVISIDLPSGMATEWQHQSNNVVKAEATLTIEFAKLGMLLPDVGENCGEMKIVPIGLSEECINKTETNYFYTDRSNVQSLLQKRKRFAHKNTYGHALLICGSKAMSGAATLATGGALRSGCGLVTVHMPAEARYGVMINYPSAMFSLDAEDCFSSLPDTLDKYTAIGVGCGLGQDEQSAKALKLLLRIISTPLVLDADALNIISENKELLGNIPKDSILTPHVGELKRLIGAWSTEEEKVKRVRELALSLNSTLIVKGANTMICFSDGECHFNSTGNAGMAKGGSGDVLTGLLTGLLARGYTPREAAVLGVYLHGLAGDLAATDLGMEAMISADLIDYLPKAFKFIS